MQNRTKGEWGESGRRQMKQKHVIKWPEKYHHHEQGGTENRTNMTANIFMTWQLALEELIKN